MDLRATILALFISAAAAGACLAAPDPDVVAGRVLDDNGRPIAGALVSAWSFALAPLTNAATVNTQTDADGRFRLPVPLAGARYYFWIRRTGYTSAEPSVIAGVDGPVEARLKPVARIPLAGFVGDGATGAPAPGARVVLIAEYGERWEVKTDAAGRFRIDGLAESIGQGMLFAESNGRLSSYRLARSSAGEISLALGAPGRIAGRVVDCRTSQGIAAADVTVRPNFMSGFSMTTVTGADGRFALDGVPPGDYTVDARHPGWAIAPQRDGWERIEVPVEPAGRGFVSIEMKRTASISGRVVAPDGKSVSGALVATRAFWDMTSEPAMYRLVRTDGDGRFLITTGRLGEDEPIVAISPQGVGTFRPGKLTSGQAVEDAVITLGGATRVRGVAHDEVGHPIPGVSVESVGNAATDEQGRFDLGLIPLREAGARNKVVVRPPRPDRGGINTWRDDGTREPLKPVTKGERFFHPKEVAFEPAGPETAIDIALVSARLVTFAGRVLDDAGKPVPHASVVLLSGKADDASLRNALHPEDSWLSSKIDIAERRCPALCRTATGEDGRFTMTVVHETAEGMKLLFLSDGDADIFSLGAEGPGGATALAGDLRASDDRAPGETELKLGKALKAQAIRGRVVDTDGAPMKDIVVQTSFPLRHVRTDADGRFAVDRGLRDNIALWFRLDGWSVLSPTQQPHAPSQVVLNDLAAGVDDLDVVLGRNGVVTGTVKRKSGKPVTAFKASVPGAKVFACDADGKFRLEGCPPNGPRVVVTAPDGTVGEAWADVKPGGEGRVEVVLADVDCAISGRVEDAGGEAVLNVAVDVTGPTFRTRTLVDEDGTFTVLAPAGTYRLSSATVNPRFGKAFETVTVTVGGDAKNAAMILTVPDRREVPR